MKNVGRKLALSLVAVKQKNLSARTGKTGFFEPDFYLGALREYIVADVQAQPFNEHRSFGKAVRQGSINLFP